MEIRHPTIAYEVTLVVALFAVIGLMGFFGYLNITPDTLNAKSPTTAEQTFVVKPLPVDETTTKSEQNHRGDRQLVLVRTGQSAGICIQVKHTGTIKACPFSDAEEKRILERIYKRVKNQ